MQNSKIISKPNPDLSMTDHVAITWSLFQTCIITPSSIPIHSIHYNHITRQMCTTISTESGKSSNKTQPKLAGDALPVALAGAATDYAPADGVRQKPCE